MHIGQTLLLLPLLVPAPAVLAQEGPSVRMPTAVRKMLSEGDKFYPEQYYAFEENGAEDDEDDDGITSVFRRYPPVLREHAAAAQNMSLLFRAPLALHAAQAPALFDRRSPAVVLAALEARAWSCPTGTASCSGIGYPYSCCATDETCYEVADEGLGAVGCCPTGSTCTGSVTSCAAGATACADSEGGGCCIAGYVCEGVGCVASSTATTTTTHTATTTTTPSSSTTSTTTTTTSTVAAATPTPSTAVVVVTVVVTESAAGTTTTRTSTSTSTLQTTSAVAPVKQTGSGSASSSLSSAAVTLTETTCPTGYYACLAYDGGGCCQTGRGCETATCVATGSSSTVVDADGVTVVVPADSSAAAAAASATAAATCASGWFSCATASAGASEAAGCCPSGYACGTVSCTLDSSTATATVQKEMPSRGGRLRPLAWLWHSPAMAAVLAILA